ncbi:hypothetical protein QN362_14330 [Actimicrobium sp. CCC2.4]|uniref:hypothetical protein n=1 Tax=Actimicrobium sp. CCC2.4 TaxID=3048606 RepID=UPI002AC8E261|nr:hypothetical protein [Actimicrobium sp. CCC2.4]MEB0136514.1 hypothetical protein [Actimicrobium sp. CCC2.4]WPX30875.1 hypothetical protein RHM62_11420 [Actimicrobium sp. CCC2.4]
MTNDPRCCGTDTCMINAEGQCWCGQQWDGEKMCHPTLDQSAAEDSPKDDEEAQ